jgi:hypothetical protein
VVVYKVLYKDYEKKACRVVGELRERRRDLRGMTYSQTGLKWAKIQFGESVRDKQALLVIIRKLDPKEEGFLSGR